MRKKYYRKDHRKLFYKETFDKCQGCCMICGEKERLVIDHDHITGFMRGLLCYKHNTGLGMFQDSVDLLQRTINYLDQHGKIEPPVETVIAMPLTKETSMEELLSDPKFKSDRARSRSLAIQLGISPDAAQARVRRARQKLKCLMHHTDFSASPEAHHINQ